MHYLKLIGSSICAAASFRADHGWFGLVLIQPNRKTKRTEQKDLKFLANGSVLLVFWDEEIGSVLGNFFSKQKNFDGMPNSKRA